MKLTDLLNEIETNEVVKPEVVDEIGKFFVVKKPTKGATKDDIMMEVTVFDEIRMDEVRGCYKQKSDASRVATEAIKEYEGMMKEVETAMDEFRSAKTDIEEKKKLAKEKIASLK